MGKENTNKLHKNVKLEKGVLHFNSNHECSESDALDFYDPTDEYMFTLSVRKIIDDKKIMIMSEKNHEIYSYYVRKSNFNKTETQ
jgi:hypothetical protein